MPSTCFSEVTEAIPPYLAGQLEKQGMGNGTGTEQEFAQKATQAETRRLLVQILFTTISGDNLGLTAILFMN